MTAQEINAASCLEQLEAHIQRLMGTLDEVCATIGLPANCGLMMHPRPCLDKQPGMKIKWLGGPSQDAGNDNAAEEDECAEEDDEHANEGTEGSANGKGAGGKGAGGKGAGGKGAGGKGASEESDSEESDSEESDSEESDSEESASQG